MPRPDPRDERQTVPIAVTRDGELAARWVESLRDAGIEADVEIGDAQTLIPSSTLAVAGGPVDAMFAYELRVPAAERRRATDALARPGARGGTGEPGTGLMLKGALVALAAGAVVIGIALARLMTTP